MNWIIVILLLAAPQLQKCQDNNFFAVRPPLFPTTNPAMFSSDDSSRMRFEDSNEDDPILGAGLGLHALGLKTKAKTALLTGKAKAAAFGLKAKTDINKHLMEAQLKKDLAKLKATASGKLFFHGGHLLRPRLLAVNPGFNSDESENLTNEEEEEMIVGEPEEEPWAEQWGEQEGEWGEDDEADRMTFKRQAPEMANIPLREEYRPITAVDQDEHNFIPMHENVPLNHNVQPTDPNDPVVGAGLKLPLLGPFSAGAKARAILNHASGPAVYSLGPKATLHHPMHVNKLHKDIAAAKARAIAHKTIFRGLPHHLIGAENPTAHSLQDEINRDLMPEVPTDVNGMNDFNNHQIHARNVLEDTQDLQVDNPEEIEELEFKPRMAEPRKSHMQTDEELFVWSLNNYGNNANKRSVDDVDLVVTGQPVFWTEHEVHSMQPNAANKRLSDEDDQNFLTNTPNSFSETMEHVEAPHFGHFGFHHHGFGKTFSKSPFELHSQYNGAPITVDHWGNPMAFLNKPDVKPTHVTINNQQNTFTNAIPTHTGGSNTIQIAQTNGNSAASQASSSKRMEQDDPRVRHIIEVPYRRAYKRSIYNYVLKNRNVDDVSDENNDIKIKATEHDNRGVGTSSKPILRRSKRSLPLLRLVVDPNAKLDMPKTLSNAGTITKRTFEDPRAPMYHVKNMMGSTKDAVMATMKVIPQGLIIPSQYRIVDTTKEAVISPEELQALRKKASEPKMEYRQDAPKPTTSLKLKLPTSLKEKLEQLRAVAHEQIFNKPRINDMRLKDAAYNPFVKRSSPILGQSKRQDEDDPLNFVDTFQKLGTVIRASVKAGHEALDHISDAAHSGRKVMTTSQFALPKVLLPYTRATALKTPDRVMMITPRFLDVSPDDQSLEKGEEVVGMGELMDAFGFTNPKDQKVGMRKILFEQNEDPIIQSRFGDDSIDAGKVGDKYLVISEQVDDFDEKGVDRAWRAVQGIKDLVGVDTIKDFLLEMKHDFSELKNKLADKKQLEESLLQHLQNDHTKRSNDDEELQEFLQNLFKNQEGDEISLESRFAPDETVGAGLNLPKNLLQPFMNQPDTNEMQDYFRDKGDTLEDFEGPERKRNFRQFLSPDLIAAINPEMYKKFFNETLHINTTAIDPKKIFEKETVVGSPNSIMDEEDKRFSMKFHKKLEKPYLGKLKKYDYDGYDEYGQPFGGYYNRPAFDDYVR